MTPIYPDKDYAFDTLELDISSTTLNVGDRLIFKYGDFKNTFTFDPLILRELTADPLKEVICNDCFISYNDAFHILFIRGIIRDKQIYYAYLEQDVTNRTTLPDIIPRVPKKLEIDLQQYDVKEYDEIGFTINSISYNYTVDSSSKPLIYGDGWIPDPTTNYKIKIERTPSGDKLYIYADLITDNFTSAAYYLNYLALYKINSFQIIQDIPQILRFNDFKDVLKEGDILKISTTTGDIYRTFSNADLYQLSIYGYLYDADYMIELQKTYNYSLTLHIPVIRMLNINRDVTSASIFQATSNNHVFDYSVTTNLVKMTADPLYDTPDELLVYTKSELDHIKGRCICSLPGFLNQLKYIKAKNPPNSQALRDYIWDYKVFPCTCELDTKLYIYDNYGPFTTLRPV